MEPEIRVKKMSLPARPKSSEEFVAPQPGGRRASVDVRPNQLPLDKLPGFKPSIIREQLAKPPVTREQLATIPASSGEYTEDKDIEQRGSQLPPGATPIVLRLRNEKRELNIIRFLFIEGEDTVEAVSQELVEVGLVNRKDGVVISNNLRKILEDKPNRKHRVFYLYSGSQEVPCDTKLIGFAKLSLADPGVGFT
ncbi:hypothetical protein SNE40_016941 [Patella caerulea]|uniref:non-specific serine/threonine protein kinase n=1 Tax=Patella caerulea TaxID=87958 RepID=A0AAN8PKI5_PATCE